MRHTTVPITEHLARWTDGNTTSLNEVFPLAYKELYKRAKRYIAAEKAGQTLSATGLINEFYLRLVTCSKINFSSRAHFYAFAAQVMRRVLVDRARAKKRIKRGGDAAQKIPLDEQNEAAPLPDATTVLAIDQALRKLYKVDRRKCRALELETFGGLSVEEIAGALNVSSATIKRDLSAAKRWVSSELKKQSANHRPSQHS